MESEEHAREQAKYVLENIMRMVEKLHHAETCDGDDCQLTEKEIVEGLGYGYIGQKVDEDDIRLYHDMDATVEEIYESPLSFEVRSDWETSGKDLVPMNYRLLMTTGGPAVKITGSLNKEGIPETADIEYQDWGTPWTEYLLDGQQQKAVLEFAQHFSHL